MQRNFAYYLTVYLKGIAMGAADVVPGVSGGTIAFISGIYEELISTINAFDVKALKMLREQGFKSTWKHINGNFITSLLLGIATSVVSLAQLIKWLLENEPVLLWSFFFGLVVASVWLVAREIKEWKPSTVLLFILGTAMAYGISVLPASGETLGGLYLFFAGALAICAMILPGISGAFILVLLGAYGPVLQAVNERNLQTLAIVGLGAIFGLLSFARVLKYLFGHFKNLTLALLTGFILGSLNKIWPWKEVTETRMIEDKLVILAERSILPGDFSGDPQILGAAGLALAGFFTIFLLEKLAAGKTHS